MTPRRRFGWPPKRHNWKAGDEVFHKGGLTLGVWSAGTPSEYSGIEEDRQWSGVGKVVVFIPTLYHSLPKVDWEQMGECVWVQFAGVLALCRSEDLWAYRSSS